MQKLVSASRQKKGSINEQLTECWNTVVNPFVTTLHILENIYMFEAGKSCVRLCKKHISDLITSKIKVTGCEDLVLC